MIITIEEIKENIAFAAEVMRRLPAIKVKGYCCAWPSFCRINKEEEYAEDVWLPPLPHEITAMEEILEWLKFTTVGNRRVVWLRACGMGWKVMSERYKKGRSTLIREYRTGLEDIKNALNSEENEKKFKVLKHVIE